MNITLVGQFGKESFGLHIKEGFEALGHTVVRCVPYVKEREGDSRRSISYAAKAKKKLFEVTQYSSRHARDKAMKRIMREVTEFKSDIVLCTKDYFLNYEVDEIKRKTGAKVVMWFPDGILNLGRAAFLRAGYDALFFKDSYIVRQLLDIYGKNAFYLPECFSRTRHKPVPVTPEDCRRYGCDVAMMGNLHSCRISLLEQLSDYNLRIYGTANPWWLDIEGIRNCYTGQYVADDEKAKAVACSKIQLNTLHIGEVFSVNVRTFELAGAGGFQLCQHKHDLPDLFTPEKEIVTYSSVSELREKLDWYLAHEDERKAIAFAGMRRAWKDHYYELRLQRLLNMVFTGPSCSDDRLDYRAVGE